MVTRTLDLRRNRTITAEIFDDGSIGLEIVKNTDKPNYKNGESDYHEVYFNLTYGEIDSIVEFLMTVMSIKTEGSITLDLGEMVNA